MKHEYNKKISKIFTYHRNMYKKVQFSLHVI